MKFQHFIISLVFLGTLLLPSCGEQTSTPSLNEPTTSSTSSPTTSSQPNQIPEELYDNYKVEEYVGNKKDVARLIYNPLYGPQKFEAENAHLSPGIERWGDGITSGLLNACVLAEGRSIFYNIYSYTNQTVKMSLKYCTHPEDYDGGTAEKYFTVKTNNGKIIDTSNSFMSATGSWTNYNHADICEITLTEGDNTIELVSNGGIDKAGGGFNVDYIVLTPRKGEIEDAKVTFTGEPITIKAYDSNLVGLNISADGKVTENALAGVSKIGFAIQLSEDRNINLYTNAIYGTDDYSKTTLISDRYEIKVNGVTVAMSQEQFTLPPDWNWWDFPTQEILTATLQLKSGLNRIEIKARQQAFNYVSTKIA